MKTLLPLFFSLIVSLPFYGQKNKNKDSNIPAFGVVEKADLEMKECDFDKKAEAMVLFDKGQLDFISGSGINLERHVRIKILSDKGKEKADVHLRYMNWKNDEQIKDITAQVYNLDPSGNVQVTKVDKKQIFEKQINKRYAEKIFTFPDVKPGTVIEYKYKRTNIGIIDWCFQDNIPVKYSEFTFDYPDDVEIAFTPKCFLPYERKTEKSGTRTINHFSMKNVPALRDEPYILNENDYLQKIESQPVAINVAGSRQSFARTWPGVIKELMEDEDFGLQIKKEIPRTADLDAELKGVSDPYKRMKIIFHYVKKNMEWNGNSGIWALNGVKAAWKDKKGTTGEINLILINLLRDAGLSVKPILVSTHDNGLVNSTNAGNYFNPGYNQFNNVLAWVTIGDEIYVLDATNKDTPANLIPYDVLATEGLVIEKPETFDWGWKSLWKDNMQYKNLILLSSTVGQDGKMTGVANINSYDYARVSRLATARKGRREFKEKYFSPDNPGISVDSIELENIEADSLPLVQKVHFTQQLNSSGDYQYFIANLFTGLEKNPFVADDRFSDVFFGTLQNHTLIGNVTLPAGYELEELPKNLKMIMADTSIIVTRMSQVIEDNLQFRINLEFRKPIYSTAEYGGFKEFYKKLFDLLNEQFVIHKKAKP